ncbi:DUF4400 domain-containing protein [Legionella maceachernii]|uniref:Fe2+/Zn2+ uptake regulation protein n=1 Tax=Legionella maceachernii TaxID=466 RepID=A0A0W0VV45_9GAMM|nr:DUF4400 domain-containing protein [Legionella maceachernii]KTD23935.1 hypothetical protein Lmac_2808 [Legionella maceachernii]SKA18496.1 integrating conjugative element membrane protein, PFL_4697 family [Legionella maceachernii]SUP04503.1 integrating conjugative element membrane protein, PFL_4697 family [Legionella maceachernii]
MAISRQTIQTRRLLIRVIQALFLGWLLLLGLTLIFWIRFGFEKTTGFIQTLTISQCSRLPVSLDCKLWFEEQTLSSLEGYSQHTQTYINYLNSFHIPVDRELNTALAKLSLSLKQFWDLTRLTFSLVSIKLLVIITGIPLFLLAITVGLVDGLNQRAIRTYSLGRESSFVFHQLTRQSKKLLLLLITAWVALPISFSPDVLFIPASLLFGLLASFTTCRFKKYA